MEEKAVCRAGILVCDPDCLCVIFSFIRDEQPRVGLVCGCVCVYGCMHVCVCLWMQGVGRGYEGVASLEVVNRIIKRTVALPRRQK